MAALTYIEGSELRKWVQQHLSRTLFQVAHELAVETKCEILVKIQDSQNTQDSHYYATQALEKAFSNGGLQREKWDTDITPTADRLHWPNALIKAELKNSNVVNTTCSTNDCTSTDDTIVATCSEPSLEPFSANSVDDGELPSLRRHPFGIIPLKQKNNTTQQRVSNQETNPIVNPVVSVSQQGAVQPVAHTSQPSIQITQQNSSQAVVQVVPSSGVPQASQVRTINAQGTTIQIAGGNAGPTTVVPIQQLNQLKQGQVFIMQKVGNTQMLTPVTVQQGQSATPAPNVVSPRPQTEKRQQDSRKGVRPVRNESPGTSSGGFSGRPFKCGVCYKTFGSVQVLSRHSQTFHELVPNKRFFCDLCGKNYKHPQHLQQHMATHNSTAPYKCSQCHRGFYRMGTLKDHELLHLGMYRYYCPECRKGFMRPSLLQEHINRFHTATVTPSAPIESANAMPTNVVPTSVMYLQQTVPQEAVEEDADLQQDNKEDLADANLSTEANADDNENGMLDSSQDLQDNSNEITIKQERMSPVELNQEDKHEEDSTTQDDNQNDQAGSSLTQPENQGSPSILGQLPTMVPISTASSPPRSALLRTILPKLGDYTSLKSSVATVSGRPQRRYSCDICGKTYKYVFHMREHRLTHSGQHPFVCKICNTGFFRQRQLREHQFRHSGSFPYSCDKCNKGFFRPSELRRHQSVKHGIVVSGGDG